VKNFVIVIALVFFLKPIFPVIEYVVNYDYITKTLCVNKAKPQMQCNGKCHLMKELAKATESEKPISSDKKQLVQESEVLFLETIPSFVWADFFTNPTQKINANYSNLYSFLNSCVVEHPPTIIS
jgi:hypothetical protein